MGFTPYPPSYPLSLFINMIWCEIGQTNFTYEKVLPTGSIDLLINLGSPHLIVDRNDYNKQTVYTTSWICGMQSEYLVISAAAETQMMGVSFKPGGAFAFFGFPMSELNGQVVNMDCVWDNVINELREQLLESPSLKSRFQLIEHYLMKRLKQEVYEYEAVLYALNRLKNPSQPVSVRDLSVELGFSNKHVISLFKRFVGQPPKLVARIARFTQALNSINPTKPVSWAEVAHSCFYYDQAHFNKDFRSFTGVTPSAYIDLRKEYYGIEAQGEHVNFVPIG